MAAEESKQKQPAFPFRLTARPLTAADFAPFGDVIQTTGAKSFAVNAGTATRFHDLARVEVGEGGRALISIFRSQPVRLPCRARLLERHPLGSQAFVPRSQRPFLVLVAPAETPPHPKSLLGALSLFLAQDGQGINYAPGVWHHPLLALEAESEFLVVDRGGPGDNCDEVPIPDDVEILLGV